LLCQLQWKSPLLDSAVIDAPSDTFTLQENNGHAICGPPWTPFGLQNSLMHTTLQGAAAEAIAEGRATDKKNSQLAKEFEVTPPPPPTLTM